MQMKRAIIFFVRDGRREEAVKPLPVRYRQHGYGSLNRRFARRLRPLLDRGTNLIVVSDGSDLLPGASARLLQRGATFGERLGNAISDTFALGYQQVVAIGNDCPTLSLGDLDAAFDRLDADASLVAAPTHDGGAFLIGARHDRFAIAEFIELPWQSSRLFTALTLLPGAAALPILREDYDAWHGEHALAALGLLFGDRRTIAPRVVSRAIRSPRQMKALTRIFLPAPPLCER